MTYLQREIRNSLSRWNKNVLNRIIRKATVIEGLEVKLKCVGYCESLLPIVRNFSLLLSILLS